MTLKKKRVSLQSETGSYFQQTDYMSSVNCIQSLSSFTAFFQENHERFIAFANSYLRDRAEAEDVVMESMASLWENRDKWQAGSNLKALLLTIIKNKALNHLEHRQVRMRVEGDITDHRMKELNLRISTLQACDPDRIFDSEIQQIVDRTLKNLPSHSRNIFVLSRYKNTPNKEIAAQLDMSLQHVEYQISKVLKVLRHALKDYLFSILF